jgi:hypothetical protein
VSFPSAAPAVGFLWLVPVKVGKSQLAGSLFRRKLFRRSLLPDSPCCCISNLYFLARRRSFASFGADEMFRECGVTSINAARARLARNFDVAGAGAGTGTGSGDRVGANVVSGVVSRPGCSDSLVVLSGLGMLLAMTLDMAFFDTSWLGTRIAWQLEGRKAPMSTLALGVMIAPCAVLSETQSFSFL